MIPDWRRFQGFVAQAGASTQARFWLGGVEALLPVHPYKLVERSRPRLRG